MFSKIKRNKKLAAVIIAVEILIGAYALVFIGWAFWNRPLGPSLQMVSPLSVQAAASTPGAESQGGVQDTGTITTTGTTGSSFVDHLASFLKPKAEHPKTICGGPPVMTLLLIGSDQREEGYLYGLADSIRLIRIDFTQPSVMTLDIPRDLWVEIPGIAEHGVDHGKINQAFFFGNPGMGFYDGPGEGPGLLARTLQLNYGVQGIDHYIAMDMPTFRNIIDSMGGLDVYIDSYIDLNQGQDGANPDYVYYPGYYHLNGEQALMFARLRIPTIFQRARLQDMLLQGLRDKMTDPGFIAQIPGLITQFSDATLTDLSANEIKQLICLGQKINSDNMRIVAFPDSMFSSESTYDPYRQVYTYTLGVDVEQMRAYFADFMKGTWPDN